MKNAKAKKIIDIVVTVLQVIVIIASIGISIAMLVGKKSTTEGLGEGTNITVVLSSSMNGTNDKYSIKSFAAGDLLVVKSIAEDKDAKKELKVGDVVTVIGYVDGDFALITHRIIKINVDSYGGRTYIIRGDAEKEGDEIAYTSDSIQGVVKMVVPKIGYAVNWLQDQIHFLIVVIIPLVLLLIYNVYAFIKMYLSSKLKKAEANKEREIEAAKEQMKAELLSKSDEEEIKKKAIEEYLASLDKKETKE